MLKRFLVISVLAAAATSAWANFSNGPDESGVVFRFNFPFGLGLQDPEAGLVALGGPPPELGCLGLGFDPENHQIVVTPVGPIKVLIHDDSLPFFIYAASSIGEVCVAALTTGIEPIAMGSAKVRFNDNFLNFEPGSRANAFGGQANGTVFDADGNPLQFHASIKLFLDRDGNFRVIKETINLN